MTLLKYTTEYFSHCCVNITTIYLQNFFIFPNSNSDPLNNNSPFPTASRPWQLSMNLTALGTSHRRNQIIFILLCWSYCYLVSSKFIHVVACDRISFLFYWIYNLHLFIHLSTDGHLDCFQLFVVVNSAVTDTSVQIFSEPAFNYVDFICKSRIAGSL